MTASVNPGHGKAVSAMFARIVRGYDLLNTLLSCGMDRVWRARLVREALTDCPRTTGRILDLAAGTLDVSLVLHRQDARRTVLALDFCLPMLVTGRRKLRDNNIHAIKPVLADALHLPLSDASVDAITIAFGIRNILPRHIAFAEMLRVLVPGGRACILEFGSGKNRIWGGLYNVYLERILPGIARLVSSEKASHSVNENRGENGVGHGSENEGKQGCGAYAYLAKSICAFPTALELEDELCAAGFVTARHIPLTSGIVCLHTAEKKR